MECQIGGRSQGDEGIRVSKKLGDKRREDLQRTDGGEVEFCHY